LSPPAGLAEKLCGWKPTPMAQVGSAPSFLFFSMHFSERKTMVVYQNRLGTNMRRLRKA
jgi:hypothetical protein